MGIQPLGTSSGSISKLLLFPSFCTCPERSLRTHLSSFFYMIFCFISCAGQEETTIGDKVKNLFFPVTLPTLIFWGLLKLFQGFLEFLSLFLGCFEDFYTFSIQKEIYIYIYIYIYMYIYIYIYIYTYLKFGNIETLFLLPKILIQKQDYLILKHILSLKINAPEHRSLNFYQMSKK